MNREEMWEMTYISVLTMMYHPGKIDKTDAHEKSKTARAAADLAIMEKHINHRNGNYIQTPLGETLGTENATSKADASNQRTETVQDNRSIRPHPGPDHQGPDPRRNCTCD